MRTCARNRIRGASTGLVIGLLAGGAALIPATSADGQGSIYSFDASGNLATKTSGTLVSPQILGQPQQQVVEPGKSASFSVALADTQGVTYQWRFNGNPIGGATSDALLLTNVSAANEGSYSVVVTNSAGNSTSSSAALYIDSDGDGLADSWEMANFGNLNQTAAGDFDGDGISNLDEFLDGTDPTSGSSVKPRLALTTDGGGAVSASPNKLSYNVGEVVTLTGTAFSPNTFHGWSGDLTTQTSPGTVTMTASRSVEGHFIGAPLPSGIVSWWRAEGDAQDALGINHGTLLNGLAFGTGESGQAFNFTAATQQVKIPASTSLNVGSGTGLTVEAWVKPADLVERPIAEWNTGSTYNSHFWMNVSFSGNGGSGCLYANLVDSGNNSHYLFSPNGIITANQWQHVAMTYDRTSGVANLFLNGIAVASSNLGSFVPLTNTDLYLGYRPGGATFSGLLDEAAVYNRALTAEELQDIYLVGPAGKNAAQPLFTSSSQLADAVTGTPYTQQLSATMGTGQLTYWLAGGRLPPGLTVSTSGLITGTPTYFGIYNALIQVTDAAGQSAQQQFTIHSYAPVNPSPGLVSWWRAENNALDSIGSNNGALINSATFAAGKTGQAFLLDGNNQSVEVPDSASLRPASVTLEAWVQFSNATGVRLIIAKALGAGSLDSYALWLDTGTLRGVISDATSVGTELSAPFTPVLGQWYHVAYTFDDATKQQSLYLNGALMAAGTVLKSIGYDTHPFLLGRDDQNGSPQYFFAGRIDEAAIYNRALLANEVASVFNAGPAGKAIAGPYFNTVSTLPNAIAFKPYSQTISIARASGSVTYTLLSGALPAGLNLAANGLLSGTPSQTGSFSFTVRATDSTSAFVDQTFTMQVYAIVLPPGNMLAWWRAENNANDSLGNYNGTLNGGVGFSSGKVGQAFNLDGGSGYVSLPNSSSMSFSGPFSVELWVNGSPQQPGQASGYYLIIDKSHGFTDSTGWGMQGTLDGLVGFFMGQGGGGSNNFSGAGTVTSILDNQWHHLVGVFTGSQALIYKDGVLEGTSGTITAPVANSRDLEIGSSWGGGNRQRYFHGLIDETTIYDHALSAVEVASLFNSGSAGKTSSGPYFSTPAALPDAVAYQSYSQTLAVLRATNPVSFALIGGSLPTGLTFSSSGLLSGTPTQPGNFSFAIRVTDANNATGDQTFSLQVLPRVSPPAGIISWWRAENNALDSIGINHGALTNGATFAAGKVGQAFSLDGVNDSINIPDALTLRPASLTLEAWVLFNANNGVRIIMNKPVGGGISDSYGLWLENGNLKGVIGDAAGLGAALSYPFSPILGRWYYVGFTFDNATKQQVLYLDGVAVASGAATKSPGYDTGPMLIGCDIENGTPSFFFSGEIDEPAIYNRALGAKEIASLYSGGSGGKTSAGPYIDTPPQVPDGVVGLSYSQTVTSARGVPSVAYSVVAGALPGGLTLNPSGLLSGTPTVAGDFNFIVRVTDAGSLFGDQSFTLHISTRFRVPTGLVSWWRAENDALDSIGPNNGTLTNGTTFAPGKVSQAFFFDGVNDDVNVPDSPSLRPSSVTLEAWVSFNAISTGTGPVAIFTKPLGSGILDSFFVDLYNGNLRGAVSDSTGFGPILTYPFTPVLGRWYHVAFTFDNATKQQVLYLDGVTVNSGNGTKSLAYDSQPVLIGRDTENGSPNFFFSGEIDEPAIYNRAITAQEINSIHTAGVAGKRLFFPLESWKLAHFGNADASDTSDPENDGVANLLEYAFGMDPLVADVGALPQVSTFNYPDGRRLRIIFPRDPTKNDVTIEVQATGDLLGTWSTIASSVLGGPTTGAGYFGGDGPGLGIKQVEVRDVVNISDAPRRFLRIKISR